MNQEGPNEVRIVAEDEACMGRYQRTNLGSMWIVVCAGCRGDRVIRHESLPADDGTRQ